ncbi:MAG: phosphoribosylglycinamide formyltransferase [Clostridia bacterium]|nr:phosphoribosylglycinamide formyltransferase [Clostridia bacterium]
MKRIGVLVSGGGTNLQAIIDGTLNGTIQGEVALVVSNRKNAFGLERAKKHGIPALYIGKGNYPEQADADAALLEALESHEVDVVVLAGYLNILSPAMIARYRNKIINIHPSLIPAYSGMGYYGMKVHEAVIANHEAYSGATVHFVDEGTDTGEIIVQERVRVSEEDTPETLAKKVLVVEHRLLVESTAKLCSGNL